MNRLVGYGASSESDDEDVEDVNNSAVDPAKEVGEVSEGKRTRNFLLEPGSGSSESDGESLPEREEPEPHLFSPHYQTPTTSAAVCQPPNRLPPPSLNTCFDNSVFANPFKAQADRKLCVLQKHVPLTMEAKPSQIGGKRMCVSYRKDGRCRFGIKCKFAHDSDLQTPVAPTDCQPPATKATPESDPAESNGGTCDGVSHKQEAKEDESGGQQVKRRRVGLSNTLIPPKRALKQIAMQRGRERLNMSR